MIDDGTVTWPFELTQPADQDALWYSAPTNLCLDFHGDPAHAEMTMFSDGNHHMALQESLLRFQQANPGLRGIFYTTTPPGVTRTLLERGGIQLGNLEIRARPDLLIGPDFFLRGLMEAGRISGYRSFMTSRGCTLLIRRENPRKIVDVNDLLRQDVRIACSNPDTERASYQVYRDTALRLLKQKQDAGFFSRQDSRMVFSRQIHHREVPCLLAQGQADVAVVYHHLGLRYQRIFPELFTTVSMNGLQEDFTGHIITHYGIASMNQRPETEHLVTYLLSSEAREIYQYHGLAAPQD